jgi:hypothetical protein
MSCPEIRFQYWSGRESLPVPDHHITSSHDKSKLERVISG